MILSISQFFNRYRANLLRRSIYELDIYKEVLDSKKQERTDLFLNEGWGLASTLNSGSQAFSYPQVHPPEEVEANTKSNALEMNVPLSAPMLDLRVCFLVYADVFCMSVLLSVLPSNKNPI